MKTLYEQLFDNEKTEYASLIDQTLKDVLTGEKSRVKDKLQAISLLAKLENSYTDSTFKKRKLAGEIETQAITIDNIYEMLENHDLKLTNDN